MGARSAGILLYRRRESGLEVLLVHPGGPFWARRDAGAWTIPKGEPTPGEEPAAVAIREFGEETGTLLADAAANASPALLELGEAVQKAGKRITAFAVEGDLDAAAVASNHFEMEWPPRSGRRQSFPEVDRAAWFRLDEARIRMNPAQAIFIDRLEQTLA